MLALAGLSVGAVGARLGKGTLVVDAVFGGSFVFALFAALFLGLENNRAFSDETLRRYPLTRFERLVARYAVGLLDPLWIFVFVLDLGVAAGSVALGASLWWVAVPAAILLFLTNYLAARLLVEAVGRIMGTRSGPVLLILGVVLLFTLPAMLLPALRAPNRFHAPEVLAVLRFSPPLAAATVVAGAPALASAGWMALIVGWFFGLGAALVRLERKPPRSTAVSGGEATWDGIYDRVAPGFGPALAPLVGKTLRYYVRSPQLWLNYPSAAIGSVIIALMFAHGKSDPLAGFLVMLGVISVVGFLSMGAMPMNAFGFDRSGFRRYFLFPVAPADILRAVAVVPLLLGAALIPITLGIWFVFWRGHLNARMVIMLFSSGFGGMFLFQALGLWTSLLTPRAMDFKIRFGNKLSFYQNALMFAGIVFMFWLPTGLRKLGSSAVLQYWWVLPVMMVAAACFYFVTLREGARVFSARRERMLSTIERGY